MVKMSGGILATIFLIAFVSPAAADKSIDPKTTMMLQDVIKKQLDAFAHEDAKTAESFATPAIKEKFLEPARFFEMVKRNYAPLVRPKSTQFGDTIDSPDGPLQKVTFVVQNGTVWTAIYSFQKVDGEWRISGCSLKREEGQQAI